MGCVFWLVVLILSVADLSFAAQSAIQGVVRDSSGNELADAQVQIQSESTGARWRAKSDHTGNYSVPGLPPGQYKVTVRFPGFRTVSKTGAVLAPERALVLDFTLTLLTLHEVVTVTSSKDDIDPSSGESLIVTRNSPGAALPANGPDYRMLFDVMPGVVVTPAGVNDGGQFTSQGQRPNTNAFRVDGVSANTGVGGTLPGSFPGASLPAMSAIGSTQNLGSSESTQSVELRVADFTAETGSRFGSEALIITRSGSNEFHGELSSTIRDNSWSARDWFANANNQPFMRPSYRGLTGVFGGPVWRNRTFFFLSVDNTHLNDSGLQLTTVPSIAARRSASPALRGLLDAFGLPIGPDLSSGVAEGLIALGGNAHLGEYSSRIDQALGSWGTLFARYVRSPSSLSSSVLSSIQGVSDWSSTTIGVTAGRAAGIIHDIRLNDSRARFRSTYGSSPWVAAFPFAGSILASGSQSPSFFSIDPFLQLLPQLAVSANVWGLSIPGLGQFILGGYGRSRQDQWELSDTMSRSVARHQFRAGLEYLRLRPSRDTPLASFLGTAPSLQALLAGDTLAITITQSPKYGSEVQIGSFFAQDTFRLAENLNLIYGVRWELTPPVGQLEIPTVSGLWTGTNWKTTRSGDIKGAAPWPMRYGQFAPRAGLAYRLPKSGLVLRTGAGFFFDPALGPSINPINGDPFNSWLLSSGETGVDSSGVSPVSPSQPGAVSSDVLRFLSGPYPALRLPASYQWRASLEKGIASRGTATLAYVGSTNRHLLGNEVYIDPSTAILDRAVILTGNSSTYNALQARISGQFTRKLYGSTSYNWSHCIDDGSADSSVFLVHPGYTLREARGSCDFDVRHAVTTALSYQLPHSPISALSSWTVSGIFRVRTGFPINIAVDEPVLGEDFDNAGRPNLVPGEPIWLTDPSVAGHRRLNPAAFAIPPSGRQGTLGRNSIYGNGLNQLDISLRREFELFRGTSLEVGMNIFNVLNHPAFGDPVPFMSSPLFGQSVSMQNLMLGSGTPNTGLPPLFQTGGSRSAELRIRFFF